MSVDKYATMTPPGGEADRAEWLRRILDAVPAQIAYVDQERRYRFLNAAYTARHGADVQATWTERPIEEVLEPDLARLVIPHVDRALSGESVEYASEHEDRDGTRRSFRAHYIPDRAADGTVLGLFALIFDTTETTRALDAMRRMELDMIRSAKLESLGVLAGGIAHDFNNLLTGILGSIEVLAHAAPGDRCAAQIKRAQQSCERARALAGQLLTFSRGGEPVTRVVAPGPLVRTAAEFAMRGSTARLIHDLPEALWPVQVDPPQIHQVFNNLALNAQQAVSAGGTIRVTGRNRTIDEPTVPGRPAGTWVLISIADDGDGIPPEHMDRIFDPYFTTRPGGTGLGLSAAFSIVRHHGGWIDVRSTPGGGTSVDVGLPALPEAVLPLTDPSQEVVYGRGRVLVMDDEVAVREVAGEMLEALGYWASLVADGAAALTSWEAARAAGRPYDAVVMDLSIPGGMGGREAVRHLLELDPDAVAIVSSGYSNDPVMANHRDHGFRGVIRKPYFLSELGRTLAEALGRRD